MLVIHSEAGEHVRRNGLIEEFLTTPAPSDITKKRAPDYRSLGRERRDCQNALGVDRLDYFRISYSQYEKTLEQISLCILKPSPLYDEEPAFML